MTFNIHLEAVVPPDCTLEKVKQAFEAEGWKWVQRIPAQEAQFHEEIWLVSEEIGAVRHVFDHFLEVSIIRAESNIGGMVATLLQKLEGKLPLLYVDDLVDLIPSEDAWTRGFALRGLSAITPLFHGIVFRGLRDAALDPDPRMRGLALRCIARYPWFQFIKVLEAAASQETVPELHAEQLALIDDIRRYGKRGI